MYALITDKTGGICQQSERLIQIPKIPAMKTSKMSTQINRAGVYAWPSVYFMKWIPQPLWETQRFYPFELRISCRAQKIHGTASC